MTHDADTTTHCALQLRSQGRDLIQSERGSGHLQT